LVKNSAAVITIEKYLQKGLQLLEECQKDLVDNMDKSLKTVDDSVTLLRQIVDQWEKDMKDRITKAAKAKLSAFETQRTALTEKLKKLHDNPNEFMNYSKVNVTVRTF
jgi:hypothetical protein